MAWAGVLLFLGRIVGVSTGAAPAELAVRGLHLMAPSKADLPKALEFIQQVLPKEGVNTLVLEFDYHFNFQSRPEFADPSALGADEMGQIVRVCREKHIDLIPQLNCLGHQSWAAQNGRLLEKHSEFDETPGKYPGNKGIYCRSYCPLHPEVHAVLFDLIDELARACQAKAFHVGMDEVFILGDPDCPRCHGRSAAELFASEVNTLHAHLKNLQCQMWMWGDRFLDANTTQLGEWEASKIGTAPAIDRVSKGIIICDWHYDRAAETPRFFVEKGFSVIECPWRKTDVALSELKNIRELRATADREAAQRALGVMETTWCGFGPFVNAYQAQAAGTEHGKGAPAEAAHCFATLFKAIRQGE